MISIRKRLSDSLIIQGVTLDKLDIPEDLKQGIIDYYKGKGMPLKTFEKYYTLRKGIRIQPRNSSYRTQLQ